MASIYRHRAAWQAIVTVNGRNQKKNFPTYAEAKAWAARLEADLERAHAPHLGGPAKTSVARMLFESKLYSIGKDGIKQELSRINRYCEPAGLPAFVLVRDPDGRRVLRTVPRVRARRAGRFCFP
ncbi:hypothetical protein [Paraburkholderia franconis]|uniref:hypothetical protein n=1 Tax=Paraburkholderia franconis TaxID=2654983 RepID=UPI00128C7F4A|nr:hypothetical protein [Paraburkholderia franconis]